MFFRKESWKDFSGFIKAKKVEIELLKETNKFLKNATNLNPLMKWYKRKYWVVNPSGLLIDAEIRQINIQIDQDGIHIEGIGSDGNRYDELSFMDKDSAQDIAQLVAGTYIDKLNKDKEFYLDMIRRTDEAIAYAKLPPKDKQTAVELPQKDTQLGDGFSTRSLASNKKAQGPQKTNDQKSGKRKSKK